MNMMCQKPTIGLTALVHCRRTGLTLHLSGMFRRSASLAIPHRNSFAAIPSLSLGSLGTRIAASNCHTNRSVKLPSFRHFKTNFLLPTRRSGGRKAGLCFARFVFLTSRGPLASHDSNPYPNRSRIARYNATKLSMSSSKEGAAEIFYTMCIQSDLRFKAGSHDQESLCSILPFPRRWPLQQQASSSPICSSATKSQERSQLCLGKFKWGLSNGGLRPLSVICAQLSTIVPFCGVFWAPF